MVEIINLRKAKLRAEAAEAAAENRVRHGRTTAERSRERLEAEQAHRVLDGAKIGARTGPKMGAKTGPT